MDVPRRRSRIGRLDQLRVDRSANERGNQLRLLQCELQPIPQRRIGDLLCHNVMQAGVLVCGSEPFFVFHRLVRLRRINDGPKAVGVVDEVNRREPVSLQRVRRSVDAAAALLSKFLNQEGSSDGAEVRNRGGSWA